MKRLVTQFDETRTRATVATPTCCCCCCCVGSLAASTAVTVLNVNDLVDQTEMRESKRWLYLIAALLVLPLAVLAGIAVAVWFGAWFPGLIASLVTWSALLLAMYRQLGLGRYGGVTAITVVSGAVLFLTEFFAGLFVFIQDDDIYGEPRSSLIDEQGFLFIPWGYFPVGFALAVPAVWVLRRWMMAASGPPQS